MIIGREDIRVMNDFYKQISPEGKLMVKDRIVFRQRRQHCGGHGEAFH